ncbi:hypothetical protein BDV98DRAFT_577345 [Pterulicium gracile]|uniref:Uncharacterized protein n=1 Tax=Pterulicium gracile TaxID=1884261 RepID=A0A5C3Q5T8_9AGAR|nr:hypothetical protein BDV98DRAFT_577345 [Pterula gracilis]
MLSAREEKRIHTRRRGSRYKRIGLCDFCSFQLCFSAFVVWIKVQVESNEFPGDCQA